MKQQLGTFLQFIALTFLPLVVIGQLNFNFPLIVMPICLIVGIFLFSIGYKLRED
ncbi:hypothetical protein MNBD_PLANCTO02-2173 [hydrothermal vent metagenome]|uniref:Uncharacterized protein n=1 Tax=hydrothermal vent metagenome TaxID=652676 RepID=A0A3B1DM88_9ZZZZ